MEIHGHAVVDNLEILEVFGFAEFIAALHVHVVHEYVLVGVFQLEDTRAFHGILGLLLVVAAFGPFAGGERFGGGFLYAVAVSFGFVEKMEKSVFVHNVTVDARLSVFGQEKRFRFGFEVGEILVGISVVDYVGSVAVLHRPVHHVLVGLGIVDGLGRPYSLEILMAFVAVLDVDDGRFPVDKIGRFHEHHGAVGIPAFA